MEEKKTRKSPKRLLIDITEELHSKMKSWAAIRNISLKKYITRIITRAIAEEEKYN